MKVNFGFSTMRIDNLFTVYNCKIIVDNPIMPPVFQHSGIIVRHNILEKYTKRLGSHTVSRYYIRYCTMDYNQKVAMQKEIGIYLKNNAINKLQQKWDWLDTSALETAIDQAGDALPANWAMSLMADDDIPLD